MLIKFTKMQGLGNDFMVIDAINQQPDLNQSRIQRLSDRRFGVGFDQLLLVEKSNSAEADFKYRIFNADGGEVEQCGNGARCFVQFVREKQLTDKSTIIAETSSGMISISQDEDGMVMVNMGAPDFTPASLPFSADHQSDRYEINIGQENISFGAVSMGNPHAVILVEKVDSAPVKNVGSQLESHERFPSRVNVGFMQIVDRQRIRLRVFERGVGETLACGTGACAAVAVGQSWGMLNNRVTVELPGGNLLIEWQGGNSPVMMSGPAESVFEGQIEI